MTCRTATLLLAMLSLMAGCELSNIFGGHEAARDETAYGPIRITLALRPEVLDPPGTVTAVLTYENVSPQPVVLTSGAGCLSFASVLLDEERIPFPATQYFCTAAVTTHPLAGRARLTKEWALVIGGEGGTDVRAGRYRFVAHLNTPGGELERTFVVR